MLQSHDMINCHFKKILHVMYKEKFVDAVARAKRLNLDTPDIKHMDGSVLTNELMSMFPYLLREQVGDLEIEDVAAQCLSINYMLKKSIEDIFTAPCYYTIGYIQFNSGKTMFHQSEDDLQGMLENVSYTPKVVNIHAWLTLATMEIIDISIATSIQVANGEKPEGKVLAKKPGDLVDFEYVPMLIGEDFLEKSGAIISLN